MLLAKTVQRTECRKVQRRYFFVELFWQEADLVLVSREFYANT